tara:strand:+ start:77 stop:526 length:450 start_codon:yes stop_codon:yes gene_type:complete
MAPEEVDWEFVRSASHLHLTGITAAIGGACFKTIKKALDEARNRGPHDLCRRKLWSTLWTPQKAAETLGPLLLRSDVLFASDQKARSIFSLRGGHDQVAGKLREKFDARVILLTGISQALNAELDRCEKRKAGLEKALGGLQKADPQPD